VSLSAIHLPARPPLLLEEEHINASYTDGQQSQDRTKASP
jgi:hypothetical protein